ELPATHRNHIDSCPRCRATWESMRSVHSEISAPESDIPEPDWAHFRSSVRDELLSRSIQRQTTVRRWTGWAIRPAAAWALSLFMAVGVTTVTVVWKMDRRTPVSDTNVISEGQPAEPAAELIEAGPEKSLFDDVVSLGDEQQEQFREIVESAAQGTVHHQ